MREKQKGKEKRKRPTHTIKGYKMHKAVNTGEVYRSCCKHRNLSLHSLPQISIYMCVCACVWVRACSWLRSKTRVFGMCCAPMYYSTSLKRLWWGFLMTTQLIPTSVCIQQRCSCSSCDKATKKSFQVDKIHFIDIVQLCKSQNTVLLTWRLCF